jgi:hypothetical protein
VAVRLRHNNQGHSIAQSADGIPLETYPVAAAQTIVAILALSSLNRLMMSLIGAVVLLRYRRAVPLMFAVLGLTYLGTTLITQFIRIVRAGTPPSVIIEPCANRPDTRRLRIFALEAQAISASR